VSTVNLSRKTAPCPKCKTIGKRHSEGKRKLHDVGVGRQCILEITYSKHYCVKCRKHFSAQMDHLAQRGARYTHRVHRTAVDYAINHSMALRKVAGKMKEDHHVNVSESIVHKWVIADSKIG